MRRAGRATLGGGRAPLLGARGWSHRSVPPGRLPARAAPTPQDSRQTYRFGEAATHEEMAFDPVYPEKHAAKDTEVTYRFGERGEDDRRHRDNFDSVYSSAHAKKDTRSQIHFGDYEGPLGRSVLW